MLFLCIFCTVVVLDKVNPNPKVASKKGRACRPAPWALLLVPAALVAQQVGALGGSVAAALHIAGKGALASVSAHVRREVGGLRGAVATPRVLARKGPRLGVRAHVLGNVRHPAAGVPAAWLWAVAHLPRIALEGLLVDVHVTRQGEQHTPSEMGPGASALTGCSSARSAARDAAWGRKVGCYIPHGRFTHDL